MRTMLSASKSRISTNWPDCTLCTTDCRIGSQAGESIKPGREQLGGPRVHRSGSCWSRDGDWMGGRTAGRAPADKAEPVVVDGCPSGRMDEDVTPVGSVVLDGLTAMDTREEGGGSAPSSPAVPEEMGEGGMKYRVVRRQLSVHPHTLGLRCNYVV